MRPSFFVLQPLFARKHRVKPGKKPPLCIRVHRKAPSWTGSSRSASLVASCGNISSRCTPPKGRYRAGNAITNTAPPSGALNAVTVPSKLSTISFTMASPRPAPPLLRAREASLR